MSWFVRSVRDVRAAMVLWGTAGVLALAPACATEPPPKPVRLDPANPNAPEGQPLQLTSLAGTAPTEATPTTPAPAPPSPAQAASAAGSESAHHHHGKDGPAPSTAEPAAATTYVCPMHPDVTSTKPGKCPKCGMTLVRKNAAPPPNKKSHERQRGAEGAQ